MLTALNEVWTDELNGPQSAVPHGLAAQRGSHKTKATAVNRSPSLGNGVSPRLTFKNYDLETLKIGGEKNGREVAAAKCPQDAAIGHSSPLFSSQRGEHSPKMFGPVSLLITLLHILHSAATPDQPELTFEELYRYGKAEYSSSNWHECAGFMRRAWEDFTYYRDETLWCREKCRRSIEQPDITVDGAVELQRMFTVAQKALCLMRCKQDKFTVRRPPLKSQRIYEEFLDRKPFHYLQLCYWKLDDLPNAVKAAYTYLVAHPDNEESLENVRFYMQQPGFTSLMLIDALQPAYEKSYTQGVDAYQNGRWRECSELLNSGLEEFLTSEAECRNLCEDALDWTLNGNKHAELDVVSTKNQGSLAAQSVASALVLRPGDILMRRNRLFYADKYKNEEIFSPRAEIINFHRRDQLEKRYLRFVDEKFRFVDGELTTEEPDDRKPLKMDVDTLEDHFDYAQLKRPLLSEPECRALWMAAQTQKPILYAPDLVVELQRRIGDRYGQEPTIKAVWRSKRGTPQKSGCKRGAFIVAVDPDRCGAVLAENFDGSSVVFCTE